MDDNKRKKKKWAKIACIGPLCAIPNQIKVLDKFGNMVIWLYFWLTDIIWPLATFRI